MSQRNDGSNDLVDILRNDMPPAADEDTLIRVRASAVQKHAGADSGFRARPSRTLGGAAFALMLVAVLAVALIPRTETPAFAADKAIDALSMQTYKNILHLKGAHTESRRSESGDHDPRTDVNARQEFWIYPTAGAIRGETTNLADGSLDSMYVQIDDTLMQFQINIRYGTEQTERLSTHPAAEDATALDGIVDRMRARIADGSAKVTGSETVDGEDCWVVEYRAPTEYPTSFHSFSVTLRKSDYRLRAYAVNAEYIDEVSQETVTSSTTFNVIEEVEPQTLPADFFTFEAVQEVADRERP